MNGTLTPVSFNYQDKKGDLRLHWRDRPYSKADVRQGSQQPTLRGLATA